MQDFWEELEPGHLEAVVLLDVDGPERASGAELQNLNSLIQTARTRT
jgi:hypothetical protein